jgi:CBS domain-containing protein
MSRSDYHLDAMLRHLGAAYYDSLHGRAEEKDVSRAVAQVADHMGEKAGRRTTMHATGQPAAGAVQHHGKHHSGAGELMTTSVVSVDRITPYKEIAALLARHHIGGVPVLTLGRHVAGMVTDADLVAAAGHRHGGASSSWASRHIGHQHGELTAEQLMTSPAITTYPDASVATVARTMTRHHVRRLPVVDGNGVLIGIISRRDLLKVFLRPDREIAEQISEMLDETLPEGHEIEVAVKDGVVTLTGRDGKDELRLATRLGANIDGVVDVVDQTGSPLPA